MSPNSYLIVFITISVHVMIDWFCREFNMVVIDIFCDAVEEK